MMKRTFVLLLMVALTPVSSFADPAADLAAADCKALRQALADFYAQKKGKTVAPALVPTNVTLDGYAKPSLAFVSGDAARIFDIKDGKLLSGEALPRIEPDEACATASMFKSDKQVGNQAKILQFDSTSFSVDGLRLALDGVIETENGPVQQLSTYARSPLRIVHQCAGGTFIERHELAFTLRSYAGPSKPAEAQAELQTQGGLAGLKIFETIKEADFCVRFPTRVDAGKKPPVGKAPARAQAKSSAGAAK